MPSDPSADALAAEERRRVQALCRMLAMGDLDDVQGAMIIVADGSGIQTVPYVAPDADPREMSLWMLGAFLAHIDDSTPEDLHPLEAADHALALMTEYADDDSVGWSVDGSENGGECR